MLQFSRRRLVLSAATAGLVFGLDRAVEIIPSALAQQGSGPTPLNLKGTKFHKFKVGEVEIIQIFDGAFERDHDPAYANNASIDDVKAALRAAGLPDGKILNSYTITFARLGGKLVMFDSGNGEGGLPFSGLLAENMKAAGIQHKDITNVVITHFHPDHIFGLMTKANEQVYPDIEIMVPAAEYKFWVDPDTIAKLSPGRQGLAKRIQATLPNWKNIKQYEADTDVMAGIRSVSTYGHTPGHTSMLISSGSQQLMVMADVTNVPAMNMRNPGMHLAFDQDPKLAESNRRKIFDRVVADKVTCTGYHWGMPGAGTILKDGNGYALVPVV